MAANVSLGLRRFACPQLARRKRPALHKAFILLALQAFLLSLTFTMMAPSLLDGFPIATTGCFSLHEFSTLCQEGHFPTVNNLHAQTSML